MAWLAIIHLVQDLSNQPVDPGYGVPAPPPRPAHPIVLPTPPLQIWGGAPLPTPTPPIYYPQPPVAPGIPTHPIVLPEPPLGIWGGGSLPMPEHPIVMPPDDIEPGVPTHPIYIPKPPGTPAHPIVIPPDVPPDGGSGSITIKWKAVWTEKWGWVVVGYIEGPHPVPSQKK